MKMKLYSFFTIVFFLLVSQTTSYAQTEKQLCETYQKENLRNIEIADADLIDQFGNYYRFNELIAPQFVQQVRSGGALCQCGDFQLDFTGFTTEEEETICAVFTYISGIITTGVGGDQPIINVVKKPMGTSTLGAGLTFFTPDCGIANNFIFDVMNAGASATQPPGTASGILCINSLIPMYTMNETPSAGEYDLYTVALHEILHIIGFSSQLGSTGNTNQGFYSMWDAFLYSDDDGERLITPGGNPPPGCCDFSEFNPNLDFNTLITEDCDMNIFFNDGQNIAEVYGEGSGDIGNLMSHLHRCGSSGDQFVMHASLAALEERRTLTPEEIAILLALGYTPAGATDEPCRVIAVDDSFQASQPTPTGTAFFIRIYYDDIVANDDFEDPNGDGTITIDEIEFTFEGCGNVDIDGTLPQIIITDERITVWNIHPCADFEICYTIKGCDGLCDDGTIRVFMPCPPCLPELPPCPPPACGENLVCRGDFNDLTPQRSAGLSQSTGIPPCGFEGTPDVVYVDQNEAAIHVFNTEALAIPLMRPIQPGCVAEVSFMTISSSVFPGIVSVFGSVEPPCIEDGDFPCPAPAGADYLCMGDAAVPVGWTGLMNETCGPAFPNIDCSCVEEFPAVMDPPTFITVTLSNVENTTPFPMEFIYITTNRVLLIDDVVVTSVCDNELAVMVEQIEEVCIGQETAFEVEVCYTGSDPTPVDIEITANLPQLLGVSIPAGSPFEGGTLVLEDVVPSTMCITTTFNLFVDFTIPEGTELPITFDISSPNACLDPQSNTGVTAKAITCEIPCELAAYPTVTPVCGNELGCISLLVAGGSGDYNYIFDSNPPTTDSEFCNLPAGTYDFKIVDQNDGDCYIEVTVEVGVDPDCSGGCEGDIITVNYSVDDEYCLSNNGTTTQYYLDMHIPNWSGTQSEEFRICSDDVSVEGAVVVSMVVEDIGYALDIYTVIEVDNNTSPSEICFSVPVCVDDEELCARYCLESLPECGDDCPFDIIPEITLTPLEDNENCAGYPGSDYLAVSGSVQINGINWQDVTVEYNQLNGAPVPGGFFKFKNLPNIGGTVNTPSFDFCWNNTYGLTYFCFEVTVTNEETDQECVETFCIPASEITMENRPHKFSRPSTTSASIDWYPNPARDILNVYNRSKQDVVATITNLQGQRITSRPVAAHQSIQLSSAEWPAGLYLLNISNEQSGQLLEEEKIVVMH